MLKTPETQVNFEANNQLSPADLEALAVISVAELAKRAREEQQTTLEKMVPFGVGMMEPVVIAPSEGAHAFERGTTCPGPSGPSVDDI
ncbi:MAG: hypothetical protein ACREGJ_03625 [Candidatus Saccharimonadales bacterium]